MVPSRTGAQRPLALSWVQVKRSALLFSHVSSLFLSGSKFEYHWADGVKVKTPIALSAPEYVEALMDWIQALLDNEKIFPSRTDVPFPKHFQSVVKQIFKKLFRVYAHIYYSHFQKIVSLGEEAHLNTCFKHFYFFIVEFDLVERKEMEPLKDLIDRLTK